MRRLLGAFTTGALMILPATALAHGARMTFSRAAHHAPPVTTLPPLPPAPANTVWFHLIANDGMHNLVRVERALIDQETQVGSAWGTSPIRFGSAGIPIYIEPESEVTNDCQNDEAAGCHILAPRESIYVEDFSENITDGTENQDSMTSALSHEIIEMMVDPDGSRPEICDPVAWTEYKIHGVVVSDWTLPSYWSAAVAPPYDHLSELYGPLRARDGVTAARGSTAGTSPAP